VKETFKRDLKAIGINVVNVLWPFRKARSDSMSALLKNWDLWGPLIFSLVLAMLISIGSERPSKVFSIVYGILLFGGAITTANVNLLGGKIAFFQSMCLLGYCLFPLVIGTFICNFIGLMFVRLIILGIMLAWSSWASIPFVGGSVSHDRRALAVYPLGLMYCSLCWLTVIKE
jgi:protein YIPF6